MALEYLTGMENELGKAKKKAKKSKAEIQRHVAVSVHADCGVGTERRRGCIRHHCAEGERTV